MWSDSDTEEDCLGFAAYVETLAAACEDSRLSPLTIGIHGSWGGGKTSLMRMLRRRIDDAATDGSVLSLWFNAWRYGGAEETRTALIQAILRAIESEKDLKDDAKATLARLVKGASVLRLTKHLAKTLVTMTPDFSGFLDCFRDEAKEVAKTMEAFDRDFSELLDLVNLKQIVVFIDDLDRCESKQVIEIFETIKLFLNTPRCTFVIGADPEKIEHAVSVYHGVTDERLSQFSRDYLEKIVQLPFRIPEQSRSDIGCYVGMLLLNRHLGEEGWAALLDQRAALHASGDVQATFEAWTQKNGRMFADGGAALAEADLARVLPFADVLATGLRGNPRQVKRFLNILFLRELLASTNKLDVNFGTLLKLLVVEYTWPSVFDEITQTVDPMTGQSGLLIAIRDALGSGEESEGDGVLQDAMSAPGLLAFLKSEPVVEFDLDLRPYAFLAQTALSARGAPELDPVDERSERLVADMMSGDRVKAVAAARIAASDQALAEAVLPAIRRALLIAKDESVVVNAAGALQELCLRIDDVIPAVIDLLATMQIGRRGDAVKLVATGIVENAHAKGVAIPPPLASALQSGSEVLKALAEVKKKTKRKRGG